MNDRDRIERELRVNAALVLGMPEGQLVVRVEPSTEAGYEATVAAAAGGDEAVLRASGATEKGALWQLLTETIDRTFGTLVPSARLQEAMRLLRTTRLELMAAIRRELTVQPLPPDEPLDPTPRKPRPKRAKKRAGSAKA